MPIIQLIYNLKHYLYKKNLILGKKKIKIKYSYNDDILSTKTHRILRILFKLFLNRYSFIYHQRIL